MALLEVTGITKTFGGLVAVKNLSFSLEKGEILGMIGPNGAGKTTAFNLVSGYYPSDQGQIIFDGRDITGMRPDQICKLGLTRTFQVVKPFPEISVLDNIMVGAYIRTHSAKLAQKKAMETLDFMGILEWSDQLAGGLPVAGRKKLEIARALATEPQVILLDELMAGLRPTEMEETIQLVRQISERGIALLVVEHVMRVIMSLADRIIVIYHGEQLATGIPSEIVKNKSVVDAYLGEVQTNVTNK